MKGGRVRVALAAVIAMVLLGGVVAAVTEHEPTAPPDGARVELAGVATVAHEGGAPEALTDGDIVFAGDDVEVESGSILLHLTGGGVLEGRGGADGEPGTRLVLGAVPELVQGDLLLSGLAGVAVDAAGTVVTLDSDGAIARVRRALSVLTAVYAGGVDLESGGQERAVPALRQLGVGSLGRPAAQPEPLEYDAADAWDLRFLGAAIDLGRQLDSLSRTYSANIRRNEGHTAAGYELVLPGLVGEPDFDGADVAGSRDAGDLLVGAAISLLGRAGSFQDRWDAVFAFRDEGAEWGLVALDQAVEAAPVLGDVQQALVLAARPSAEEVATDATTSTTRPPTPTTTPAPTATTSGTAPPPPTTPATAPPPTPTTAPPAAPDEVLPDTGIPLIDEVVDPVDDILSGLLGG